MESYIGITGITSIREIETIWRWNETNYAGLKIPALGLGMVHYLSDSSRGLSRSLLSTACNYIMANCAHNYTIIHLNGWDQTKQKGRRLTNLAAHLPSSAIFQINSFEWSLSSLQQIRAILPYNQIILPLNPLRTNRDLCFELLHRESGIFQGILIDCSEGTGRSFMIEPCLRLAIEIRKHFPDLCLGVCGGLGQGISATELNFLRDLMPISTDAESGLSYNQTLNMPCVINYLKSILSLYGNSAQPPDLIEYKAC